MKFDWSNQQVSVRKRGPAPMVAPMPAPVFKLRPIAQTVRWLAAIGFYGRR